MCTKPILSCQVQDYVCISDTVSISVDTNADKNQYTYIHICIYRGGSGN